MNEHWAPLLVGAVVFAVALLRRLRRHIGRQRLRAFSLGARAALLTLACGMLLLSGLRHLNLLPAELLGLCSGLALAYFSLRLTHFENEGGVRYYTPNLYIGLALSLIFLVRLAYRFMILVPALEQQGGNGIPLDALLSRPGSGLTLALLLALASYYGVYSFGVLIRGSRVQAALAPF